MTHYYLNEYVTELEDGRRGPEEYFTAPNRAQAVGGYLDLRTDMTAIGFGIFGYRQPQIGLDLYLGDDPTGLLTGTQRDGFVSLLGLDARPPEDFTETLMYLMMDFIPSPMIADRFQRTRLYVGTDLIANRKLDIASHPAKDRIIARIQRSYRKQRELSLTVDALLKAEGISYSEAHAAKHPAARFGYPDQHRRYLDFLSARYGVPASEIGLFIPDDLPRETPVPRQTTVTESFTAVDAINTWTADNVWSFPDGSGDIDTNRALTDIDDTNPCAGRNNTTIGTDDQHAWVDATDAGGGAAGRDFEVLVRMKSDDSENWFTHAVDVDGDTHRIRKRVAGSHSDCTSSTAVAIGASAHKVELLIDGTSLTAQIDDANEHNCTDSSGDHDGNNFAGQRGRSVQTSANDFMIFDNWQCDSVDAGGGGIVPFRRRIEGN